MTPNALVDSLRRDRTEGRGSLLAYLMVDAARSRVLPDLARACHDSGVTALELGFPFSDPIADGPVLQAAASKALADGTEWSDLLDAVRSASRELPVVVMTYANPVFHHGLESACRALRAAGGSGLIVPDLALEESGPWRSAARRFGLALVQMGSPATPADRMRALARASSGFLYLVSRYGITGRGLHSGPTVLRSLVRVAHETRPDLPVLVGFGIRSPADVKAVTQIGADGAIVGSAVEEVLSRSTDPARLRRLLEPLAHQARAAL